MNLFCFTLDGSTESIYEPPYSQTLNEVLPKYQRSPVLLRQKLEWGGSDPTINSDSPQSTMKTKWNNRRSCVPTSPSHSKTSDKDINYACWISSCDHKDLGHQMKGQNKDTCKAPGQSSSLLTRDDRVKELHSDRKRTADQGADKAESVHTTGRLKKLQNLLQTKKGKVRSTSENDAHPANASSSNSPVLTCISFGTRTEKKPSKNAQSRHQPKNINEDSEEEGVWSQRLGNYMWSPFEFPQPWTPFYHTCQQPHHELWVCGSTMSLPRATEWDRFESLIQELDSKHSDLSPPPAITDLHIEQNTLTRFGRFDAFRQYSSLMKQQDNGSSLLREEDGDPAKLSPQRGELDTSPHSDRESVKASPEKTLTAIINGNTQIDEAETTEYGDGGALTRGQGQSSNSLDSLYSLNSRQSTSSGVTSGSDFSSKRDSLRLDNDLWCTGQFYGRARAHTDFVPNPYDTESLKLKVGDVIDIITKPPMGIWTGMLNGRVGNFKFIYVDVLTEKYAHEETQPIRVRHKSTVQEVLKRLSLEEYFSSMQLQGYQTVDDLMKLKEPHLTELNVTDPEHRHRLLAAVCSLQQLHAESQLEDDANQETTSKNTKADMNNSARDSGCHMPSDSPDNNTEDTDPHFISVYPLSAEIKAS